MTTDLDQILSYQSIDLTKFEIRGARTGIGNARTTGPLYVDGTDSAQYSRPSYIPASSAINGDGSFSSDSSIVTNLVFDSPYGSLTTSSLKVGDKFTANSVNFEITELLTPNSVEVDTTGLEGTYGMSYDLELRDYLIEPDTVTNTSTGNARFTQGDSTVIGIGTTWTTVLDADDFIKHDGFQQYFRIKGVVNDTTLGLVSPYVGDTTTGAYTAKRWTIGRTKIQYAKNNITFDNRSGKWEYDAIADNDLTTSISFLPFVDGIQLAFTHSLDDSAPDLMDVATEPFITLASQTQYETPQFSLPVVPYPETFELYIDDVLKDMYPEGNQDYILNYSSSPVYEIPPPPDERVIANVMFLDKITDVTPNTANTESGQIRVTNSAGEEVTDILPGSESISVDSTALIPYRDYMLETNAGVMEVIESTIDEEIVKYVGVNYSSYIDYGFDIFLNGSRQKISFPAEVDDDVLFQTATGRLKPREQEHPGPDEIYRINYMVESDSISDEIISVVDGQTVISTRLYPIKQRSIFLLKNDTILDEGDDFFVGYLSGRISFVDPLVATDLISISYTPLSKQVNDLTFENDTWFCTVHDSRLIITDANNYEFAIVNSALNTKDLEVLRIYNETRDGDYSLTGLTQDNNIIKLQQNSTNVGIGLASTDIVLIDYTFENETTEYAPIVVNYLNIEEDDEVIYIENNDLSSFIDSSALLNLQQPDAATQYYFTVDSVLYDGFGTRIGIIPPAPEDIVNPKLFVTDSTVAFLDVPLAAESLVTGSTTVLFPGANIRNIFRPKSILNVNDERYQVFNATYDYDLSKNIVSLNSEIISDTTDSTSLSNIFYSDVPIYLEGDTEIIPQRPVVTLMNQSGFIMSNDSDDIIDVTADSTSLFIDGTAFDYTDYPTLNDMSAAVAIADISAMSLLTYAGDWRSDKIIAPTETLSVYRDSSTVLSVSTALRYQNQDTTSFEDATNFSVDDAGNIILDIPLVRYDRYNTDYMGREFLGDQQVQYSANYFINLPSESKVSASFEYDNLDQFYVEVMDQRDFFENVTIPRMSEESFQLNGNVGQGGELVGDSGASASQGGLTNDEFLRQDTEIECRVFENIYDFFSDRVEAMGDEFDAALGLRLFNNDGIYNKVEQAAGHKTVTRIFQNPDYTNFEPMNINPLTGYYITTGAVFTNGSTAVSGLGNTQWDLKLFSGDFIGLADSTKRYQIGTVATSSITLLDPFEERSTPPGLISNGVGDLYTASTSFPIYDDDGNLGFKVEGTKTGDFGLSDNDVFDCYIDGNYQSYTFEDPPLPVIPVVPLLIWLLFQVKKLNAADVSKILSSGIDGLVCSVERVVAPEETFGFRDSLVLRSDTTANKITLGYGAAVEKLGFTNGQTIYGNFDRTDHNPEILLDTWEGYHIGTRLDATNINVPGNELDDLVAVEADSTDNKLNRIDSTSLERIDDAYVRAGYEKGFLATEKVRLTTEINATYEILQEPTLPSYANTLIAYNNAVTFKNDSTAGTDVAYDYAADIYPDWQDKTNNWRWALDFEEESVFIRYKDASTDIGYDATGVGRIPIEGQTFFILDASSDNDRRILNADLSLQVSPAAFYAPNIVWEDDTNTNVPGDWSGWDYTLPVDGSYSLNNQITFTLDSPILFTIEQDSSFTAPEYRIDTSALVIDWNESDGYHKHEFLFSTYPNQQNLTAAIDAVDGFRTIPGAYDPDYNYKSLKTIGATTISSPPGNTISSGLLSPAFSMYTSDPSALMFRMYSTDSTSPFYETDTTALAIIRIDGTNTFKSEFLYSSYSTIGALETAVDLVTNVNTTTSFTSGFQYSNLVSASGTMASSAPGSPLYTESIPSYEADSTAVAILRANGLSLEKNEFLYSSYTTLASLQSAIAGVTNVTVIGSFDPTYAYNALRNASGVMSKIAPGDDLMIYDTALFEMFFEMDTLRFVTDTTSLNILWEEDTITLQKNFTYVGYPTVLSMRNAVDAITGLGDTGAPTYDSERSEAFRIDSGLIDTTASIYRGLADCTVEYQTMSDALYNNRIPFITDRSSALTGRVAYLEVRESQIRSNMFNEEILRNNIGSDKGTPSDLYVWANNRFNRRQGCYARLKQIEKQIESNESALRVTSGLVG